MAKRKKQEPQLSMIAREAVIEELYARAAAQFMLGRDEVATALRDAAKHFDVGGQWVQRNS